MGKKGNWFSALKRAFTSSSKDKIVNEPDKVYPKEKKKWGFTKTRHGEASSFIPLYREPSSIEKILGDAEREQNRTIHQRPLRDTEMDQRQWTHQVARREFQRNQQQKLQQLPPRDIEREHHHHHQKLQQLTSREIVRESNNQNILQIPPKKGQQFKTLKSKYVFAPKTAQLSAIKIQAAYRGYLARKSYRALRGLMRLQSVMKGQSVKRQTTNTMRCMQMLVRVQSQIRTRRLQMMESRNIQQHQMMGKNDRDVENSLNKWNFGHQSEAEGHEGWEDSTLTKDEIDTRMRRKVEAVIKRERALAYAYSHQLLKVTPMSAQAVLSDIKSGGYPWWWNWLERQVGTTQTPTSRPTTGQATTPKISTRSLAETYPRPSSRSKQTVMGNTNIDASTPRSSKPIKQKYTPNSSNRWQTQGFKDDDSLTSCPAFTVPNYMVPTVSAKAKVRDGPPATPEGKRRFSFGLTQSIGSIRWSKGSSVLSTKDSESKRMSGRHRPMHSIGNLSMDSTISLPVGVGGRSFR